MYRDYYALLALNDASMFVPACVCVRVCVCVCACVLVCVCVMSQHTHMRSHTLQVCMGIAMASMSEVAFTWPCFSMTQVNFRHLNPEPLTLNPEP